VQKVTRLMLVLCWGLASERCKAKAGVPQISASPRKQSAVFTKEEVGAILGQPVTAVEGRAGLWPRRAERNERNPRRTRAQPRVELSRP
jgi:hypothetical protein